MHALPLTLSLLGCTSSGDELAEWRIEPRSESPPRAELQAYPLDVGAEAYFISQHVVPGLHWGNSPSTQIALDMWEQIMGENIADPGSCPYGTVDGSTRTWQTNCRSQDGYDWSGGAKQVVWEEEGREWERWDFDIEVTSTVASRSFDRVAIQGEFWFAGSDGDWLQSHTETNLSIQSKGYWDNGSRAKLEDTWTDLRVSGVWETWLDEEERSFHTEGLIQNSQGGVSFSAPGGLIDDSCATEPKGTLLLEDGEHQVELEFEAAERCDNCARYSYDGADAVLACRTSTWL